MIGDETVTWLGDATFDAYGDPVTSAAEIDIPRCAVEPLPQAEQPERARTSNSIAYRIYTPAVPDGAVVAHRSRLRVRGVVCEVDGDPEWWDDPDPDLAGFTIACHVRRG